MEFKGTQDKFLEYTNKCRELIRKTFFTEYDINGINARNTDESIDDIVKKHRLRMIDIKLDHTMRMVEQVIRINANLGFSVDLSLVIKVAVLCHDIGRMRQSTWSNNFSDNVYKRNNSKFINHGEDGYDIFINNDFLVDRQYVPIIGKSIKYHVDLNKCSKLKYKYDSDLDKINIDKIATGNFNLNEAEWQVTSLITQLVADIDKTDILYQHLSDDFNMIRDYIVDYSKGSLEDVANYWCVSKEEIAEYNKISINNYSPRNLRIPIKNMDLNRLMVPSYMREMFYNDSWLPLEELILDKNWNFITILWWRLSHFINEISFTSVLVNLEESKLLDEIYEKVPDELKFLVEEAFAYARNVLVEDRLDKNKGNVYLR